MRRAAALLIVCALMLTVLPASAMSIDDAGYDMVDDITYRYATAEDAADLDDALGSSGCSEGFYATGAVAPTGLYYSEMVGQFLVHDETTVPSAVGAPLNYDLSTDPCFPEVRSQGGQGSCAAFSTIYYNFGYLEAKDNGWTDASTGNNAHLLSPAFTFNKVISGPGSWMVDNAAVARDIGVSTWEQMPYDQSNSLNWGDEGAWRSAAEHRLLNFMEHMYVPSTTVNDIKTMLMSGTPVTITLNAGPINGGTAFSDGNYILSAYEYPGGLINHAVTIVGWDDAMTDDGETGCFKIVNSWGNWWGDDGFFYMTFDCLKELGAGNALNMITLVDRADYIPTLLGVWEFSSAPDEDQDVSISTYSESLGIVTTRSTYWYFYSNPLPTFMCLDITELEDDLNSGIETFVLDISGGASTGVLSSFFIEGYQDGYVIGSPSAVSAPSEDVPASLPGTAHVHWSNYVNLVEEDFESSSGIIWTMGDDNAAGDADYWGVTSYRAHGTGSSAWCAQVGSGQNALPNSQNHYYDIEMDAYMGTEFNLTGYDRANLTFHYWSLTDTTSDYLALMVFNGSWSEMWRQPSYDSSGWQMAMVDVPLDATSFSFLFHSDAFVTNDREGAYVDDVLLKATESTSPVSNLSCPATSDESQFNVTITASDIGSGLDYVSIYFGSSISTGTRYVDADHPDGRFMPGNATLYLNSMSGDGSYLLWTQAYDVLHNPEPSKSVPDDGIMVDTTAPTTAVDVDGTQGRNGWWNSVLTITLDASDAVSGVAELSYRIDSGDWNTVTDTVTFELNVTTVTHTIDFQATDAFGNTEPLQTRSYKIDTDAPTATLTWSEQPVNGWYDHDLHGAMTASDATSGIKEMRYSIDGGAWIVTGGAVLVSGDGTFTVRYYAIDNSGLTSGVAEDIISIDTTEPQLNFDVLQGEQEWYNITVEVNITAVDEGTGVNETKYRIDGGAWNDYSGTFRVNSSGVHLIEAYCTDLLGRNITVQKTVRLDRDSPDLLVLFDGFSTDTNTFANTVSFNATASDAVSGVRNFSYCLDGVWADYSGNISVTELGQHNITVYAIDAAGMVSTSEMTFWVVSVTQPGAVDDLVLTIIEEGIQLNWTAPDDGGLPIEHYYVYRSVNNGTFVTFAQAGGTNFRDTNVSAGNSYQYFVIAQNLLYTSEPAAPAVMDIPEKEQDMTMFLVIGLVVIIAVILLAVLMLRKRK